MEFRNRSSEHLAVVQDFDPKENRTHQDMKDECDINNIMARYTQTGIADHFNQHQGNYGNFINAPTYQDALNAVLEAQRAFETVPAQIRARFYNDPAQFLAFVQNPDNQSEMIEMGLAKAKEGAPGVPPEPTPGTPPAAPPAAPEPPPAPQGETPSSSA